MAKESMKAREVKRAKLVAKYAEKRAALKKLSIQVILLQRLRRHRNCKASLRMQIRFVYTIVAS